MEILTILLAVLAALGVGVAAGYFGSTSGLARKGQSAKEEAALGDRGRAGEGEGAWG